MIRTGTLILSALLGASGETFASTVNLSPVKDNTIYFSTAAVSNGAGPTLFAGTNGVGQPMRGLIQFDLASSIPAGSTINSVQLILYMDKTNAPPVTIQLRRVLQNWGESTSVAASGGGAGTAAATGDATWANAIHPSTPWASAGGDFSSTVSASQGVNQIGSYTWTSTPALVADAQSFVDAPSGNFGWLLLCTNEAITPSAKRFASRQHPNTSLRPRLAVDFTPPIVPFCFGNLSGAACPCGNVGLSGNGCPNSAIPGGAQLQFSGTASLSADSLILGGLGMLNGTAIYFQGTTQQAAGAGIAFGDGLLCLGGGLVRLGLKTNSAGASFFPGAGDPSVSAAGLVTAAGTRYYQVWYADTATFCSTSTFNFTNALSVTWN